MYKKLIIFFTIFFCLLEIILSILIQTVPYQYKDICCFLVVVISYLYSLLLFNKTKDYLYTHIGLLFTLLADIFLVLTNPMYEIPGVLLFCITQLFYCLKIHLVIDSKITRIIHIYVRTFIIFLLLGITVFVLNENSNFLTLISMFYYANLVTNIIFSFYSRKPSFLFSIGLILFACCDLFVGLTYIDNIYININNNSFIHNLCYSNIDIIWLFYVPSQTLIACSLFKQKYKSL
ncbi:MAG: hypothetical protein IJX78_05770 [Bacilli bacterium]|nr:hypothetical protein [Bacilli bacterium]